MKTRGSICKTVVFVGGMAIMRHLMKRPAIYRGLITALAILSIATGCGDQKAEPTGERLLRIATDPNYPPLESVDLKTGQAVGFDIDLIAEICRVNDWRYEIVMVPFDNLISGLTTRKFDLVVSAMTITPQREAVIAFSDPYFTTQQVLTVPKSDSTCRKLADLRGKRVGVQSGTTGEELAKRVDGALVFRYQNIDEAFVELEQGQLDAIVTDYSATVARLKTTTNLKVADPGIKVEHYGIALRQSDVDRLEKINQALARLESEGVFDRLFLKWFGKETLAVPVVGAD